MLTLNGKVSPTEAVAYLECVVPAMRRLGVAEFGDLKLGPDPQSDAGVSDEEKPQRITAKGLERQRREERRRIAMASSGGPLRPVAVDK